MDFGVDPLGESCGPLRMVLVDDTSIEFEEAGVRPIEVAVGEKDKEKGTWRIGPQAIWQIQQLIGHAGKALRV